MEIGIRKMKSDILRLVQQYSTDRLKSKPFIAGKTYIPAASPKLFPEDVTTIVDAALSFWYTEGKYAKKFKEELCKVANTNYATLCNSGSSANLLAVKSCLEVYKRGGKYIVTCASGFPTTISPIYQNNKVPAYVDINPITLQPKMDDICEALQDYSTAGAILTHNLGFPYDEFGVASSLRDGQFFIADCCDFLSYDFMSYSDVSTHSFFPSHALCTGEGGALTTNDEELHNLIEKNSNWGRSCVCKPGQDNTCGHRFDWENRGDLPEGWDHKYIFDSLGYNLKMTELQAALGYTQIHHLPEFINRRRELFWRFYGFCLGLDYIKTVEVPEGSNPVPFGLPIMVQENAPFTAREMIRYLEKAKIGTRRFFAGNIIRQPGFKNLDFGVVSNLKGCDYVMNNCFWISSSPSVTDEMFNYMLDVVSDFLMEIR